MAENERASQTLLNGIYFFIDKLIKKAGYDKTCNAIIKNINNDKTYDILLNGKVYKNVDSVFHNFKNNDIVKVKIPQNQYSQMYIESKIDLGLEKQIKILQQQIDDIQKQLQQKGEI